MNTQAISVGGCNPQTIVIGRRGTYNTQEITFDLSYLIDTYGAGVAALMVMRSQDETAYPAVVSQEDTTLTWTVSEIDTYYVGSGEVQLMWYVDGGLAKTVIFPMVVMRDILQTTEEPPDAYQTWVDDLLTLGAETLQNAQDAAQSASEAEQSATDAGAAKTAAENAQTAAETAQGLAEDAKTAAETAQGKAETAQGKAETAQEKAETAQTAAEAAADRAEDALEEFTTPTASATTLDPDDDATASYANGHFTFGIPKGDVGSTPDFSIGSVETLQPSQPATASITGTLENPVLNLGIPQGKQGDPATNLVQSVNGKTGAVVLDSGDIAYESTTVEEELGTINSALTSLSAVTEIVDTASGAIASFPDGSGLPMRSLVAQINPVQDLHGYENPWPAGGGVNKANLAGATSLDAYNLTTSFDTENEIITISGTVNATNNYVQYRFAVFPNIQNGLGLKAFNIPASASVYVESLFWDGSTQQMIVVIRGLTAGETNTLNVKFQMVCYEGSTAPTAWTPYSNICPISGWDGLSGAVTGFNVWDEETELGGLYTTTGEEFNAETQIRAKNYVPVVGGETYRIVTTTSPDGVWMMFFDKDKNILTEGLPSFSAANNARKVGNGFYVQMPLNCAYVRFYFQIAYGTTYNHDTSINYPSTDISYHAYTGTPISVSWQDEAGTVYGGSATYNGDGTWTLVSDRQTKTQTFATPTSSQSGLDQFAMTLESASTGGSDSAGKYCSVVGEYSYSQFQTQHPHFYVNGAGYVEVYLPQNTGLNVPIQVVAPLATPQIYTITTEQLLNTLYGQNNVWVDTGDVSVTYQASIKGYIDKVLGA